MDFCSWIDQDSRCTHPHVPSLARTRVGRRSASPAIVSRSPARRVQRRGPFPASGSLKYDALIGEVGEEAV